MIYRYLSSLFLYLAIVLLCIIAGVNYFFDHARKSIQTLPEVILNGGKNFHYHHVDDQGVVYELYAKFACIKDVDLYGFENVTAFIKIKPEQKLTIKANHVTYDKKQNLIHLFEDVHYKNSQDLVLQTSSARVDLIQKRVEGDEAVTTYQNGKTVTAVGFTIDHDTGEVHFKNKPKFHYSSENNNPY